MRKETHMKIHYGETHIDRPAERLVAKQMSECDCSEKALIDFYVLIFGSPVWALLLLPFGEAVSVVALISNVFILSPVFFFIRRRNLLIANGHIPK